MATQKKTLNAPDSKGKWRSWSAEHRSLLFLLVIAFLLRIWNIGWGLPQLYEEAIPLRFGMKLWDLARNPIDFHYFVYPSFTYIVNFFLQAVHFAAGYLLGIYAGVDAFINVYLTDPTTFAIISRASSVIFDLGTVLVTYLFVLAFAEKRTALVAAFLLSINSLHIAQSHLINVDTPFTFFCVLALFYFYKCYRQPVRKWYLLSGAAIGLATATKYHGLVLVLAFACIQIFRSKTIAQSLKLLKDVSFIYALAIAGSIFLLLNPFISTHFSDFMLKLRVNELHMETGQLGIDPNTSTLSFYFLQSLPQSLGVVFVFFSTGSMFYLLASRDRQNWVLACIPIILLILLGSWNMRADRYILPIVPFMVICGSIAMVKIWDYTLASGWLQKLGGLSPNYKLFFGITFVLVLSTPMIAGLARYHRSLALPDTRTVTRKWIEAHLPIGSAIATGPFGVELADTGYVIMPIRFNAVNSEEMVPFYDTRWYEDLDLLIASDFDYGRYKQDPIRYQGLLRFYDTLRSTWKLVQEFVPDNSQTCPTLWLYKYEGMRRSESFDSSLIRSVVSADIETRAKVDFLGKLGLILDARGKPVKGAQLLWAVLSIDPDNALARKELAEILRKLDAQGAPQITAPSPHVNGLVDQHLRKAGKLVEVNDLEGAEKEYRKVIAIDNLNDSAYVQLVMIYAVRDDKAKMIEVLTQYLAALPPEHWKHFIVEEQIRKLKEMRD